MDELATQVLPADQNQSAIIAEVAQFAERSNLQVSSITFDSSEEQESGRNRSEEGAAEKLPREIDIIPTTVVLRDGARYDNVLQFMRLLENNRRRMQVTTISLTPLETDGSILQQVTFRINLYAKHEGVSKDVEQ